MIYKDIDIDLAGEGKPFAHFFRATGYANADYTYTPPLRRMYDCQASYRGQPEYMRLHNILTLHGRGDYYIYHEGRDYGNPAKEQVDRVVSREGGKLRFNWELVDRVYDIIIGHGMRPIVETVYMPAAVCAPGSSLLPENFSLWGEVISAFARHWIDRYGLEEVRRWYFEIWNEPDNHREWNEDPSSFFALYDYFEAALHGIDQHLKAGGPAVKQWDEGKRIFRSFLEHCARGVNFTTGAYGTRLDFISVHCKGGHPSLPGPSIGHMFNPLLEFIAILKEYPCFKDTEFFNDESDIVWEGNMGISHKNWLGFRNTHYAPAFTAKMISRYCDEILDRAGVNLTVVDSDNSHLLWEKSFFSGNRSQFSPLGPVPSADLIRKPVFNIFPLLGRLGSERCPLHPEDGEFGEKYGVLATRDREGGPAFLLWNCEDGLMDDVNPRTIRLHIKNLDPGAVYDLLRFRIDGEHSSAYGAWRRMGSPWPLNRDQIRLLREHDGPALAEAPERVSGKDKLDLECFLPMHGVCLILLAKPPAGEEKPEKPEVILEQGAWGGSQAFIRWNYSRRRDLLGYRVYRGKPGEERRIINKAENTLCSYFVDLDLEEGASYAYSVSFVYADGRESPRSPEAEWGGAATGHAAP
ncbi:MAG: hypothetical protein LBD31_10515 [Treponema sp.]|jgi:xylan 1,4-beta-xylosidase|nr:hypothetical protein [Treponema sp.]